MMICFLSPNLDNQVISTNSQKENIQNNYYKHFVNLHVDELLEKVKEILVFLTHVILIVKLTKRLINNSFSSFCC